MMRTSKSTKRSGRRNLRNFDSDWKDLEATNPNPNSIPDSFRLLSFELEFGAGGTLLLVRRRIILFIK